MLRAFQDDYGVQVAARMGDDRDDPLGSAGNSSEAPEDEQGGAPMLAAQAGAAMYGVDMRIVGEDGSELPWDGGFGDLQVRGPGDQELLQGRGRRSAEKMAGSRPATWRHRPRRHNCRSPTARKDVIKSGGEWISSMTGNIAMRIGDGRAA